MGFALFRCDASAAIGGGHVMRCLTLAHALTLRNWNCVMAAQPETATVVPEIAQYPVVVLPEAGVTAEIDAMARAAPAGCDLVVVDHYSRDVAFHRACRRFSRSILVMDDLADRRYDCDILLDQTMTHQEMHYRPLVPAECELLLGPSYALLRPEFAAMRQAALARRSQAKPVRRILVSFGSVDSQGLGARMTRALLPLMPDVVFDLAGSFGSDISGLVSDFPGRVIAHGRVNGMATLMAEADLAIGAGGITSWERCALGLPSAVVVISENQDASSQQLEQQGAILLLGKLSNLDFSDAARRVVELTSSAEALRKMSCAAASIADGLGIGRVLNEIDPPRTRLGVPIRLRPVRDEDIDILFAWQTEGAARIYTRNPAPPTRAEHIEWFRKRNASSSGLFAIIRHGAIDCGVIRCDPAGDGAFEVTIMIAGLHRGRGIAVPALLAAAAKMAPAPLLAEIHADNEPSRRAFLAAGFVQRSVNQFILHGPGMTRSDTAVV